MMENVQTLTWALAMVLAAAVLGRIIHRKNNLFVSVLLGVVLMQVLNAVLRGMGFWYFGGPDEPLFVQVIWYALHAPVIWYIATEHEAQRGREHSR